MKNLFLSALILLPTILTAQKLSIEDQVASAVMAASKVQRDGATVMGYNNTDKFVILRTGTNELVCLADDPTKKGFSVACYHKDLDPMMARGRELRAEGKNDSEINKIRSEEALSGKLKLPKSATTLHVLSGAGAHYDAATNKVVDATLRYVVYIPFATQEETGLPLQPMVSGGPWLMFPGTYRAHIMISPPN